MILLIGRSSLALDAIRAQLEGARVPFQYVDEASAREALFNLAFEAKAEILVGVEPLPTLEQQALARPAQSLSENGALLEAAIGAAHAPQVRKLVWVTARTPDDARFEALRRDGVPYLVLCSLPIAVLEVPAEAKGSRILIERGLPEPEVAATTPGWLAREVLRMVQDPEAVGRVEPIGRPSSGLFVQLVTDAGRMPKLAPRWRGRLGRWLGEPRLVPTPKGAEVVCGRRRA